MQQVFQHQSDVPRRVLCSALCIAPATYYRFRKSPSKASVRKPSFRKITTAEREKILSILNSEEFADKAPIEVYATLLGRCEFHCSIRSMYRILAEHQQVRERRKVVQRPKYQAPQLVATGPNQVWSWDISRLKASGRMNYYHLYVIMDIYSRYIVGWMIADREDQELAKTLIETCVMRDGVDPTELTIHADRGAAMTSKPVAALMASLGITKSHSRPYTSNDNPFSESLFKTLKYRPQFPDKFETKEQAIEVMEALVGWYNHEHQHSGIALYTPSVVHHRKEEELYLQRQKALALAYQRTPERFVHGHPHPPKLRQAVWINPPKGENDNERAWQGQGSAAEHCPNKPRAADAAVSA